MASESTTSSSSTNNNIMNTIEITQVLEITDHAPISELSVVLLNDGTIGHTGSSSNSRNNVDGKLEAGADANAGEESNGMMVMQTTPTKCIGRSNRGISWTTVLDKGMRRYMEDRLVAIKNYMTIPCGEFGGCTSPTCNYATQDSRVHYFGVFDGHGGAQVSTLCASTLDEILAEEWKREKGVDQWGPRWEIAFRRAYEKVDGACKDKSFGSAGSTALVVLVSACQIIAANCGDSRAVLARKDEVIPLTKDHKPNRIDEMERVLLEGGSILNVDGILRVDGVLAMTRAIGDQPLKPCVSSVPEMTFTTRTEADECLIIASDGLWDVMSSEEVGRLGRELMRRRRREVTTGERSSPSVANLLLEEARLKLSSDNIAVIVVDLKQPRRWRQPAPTLLAPCT